jgi:hypothetical protein
VTNCALPTHGVPYLTKGFPFALPIIGSLIGTWKKELEPGSPTLSLLSRRWDDRFGKDAPFEYYSIAGARDRVVMIAALTSLRAEHRLIVDEDYISINKPTAERRESFEIVVTGLTNKSLPAPPQQRANVVIELATKEKENFYDVFMYYGFTDADTVAILHNDYLVSGRNYG